ncbi:hypothetical protein L3Q82_009354, partial [Scortum barcoo]
VVFPFFQAEDVNRTLEGGRKPLHLAADFGHTEVVEFLISKGADVNAPDKYGITPLLCACFENHLSCVKVLLEKGADKDKKGPDGLSAFDAAECNDIKALLKWLQSKEQSAALTLTDTASWDNMLTEEPPAQENLETEQVAFRCSFRGRAKKASHLKSGAPTQSIICFGTGAGAVCLLLVSCDNKEREEAVEERASRRGESLDSLKSRCSEWSSCRVVDGARIIDMAQWWAPLIVVHLSIYLAAAQHHRKEMWQQYLFPLAVSEGFHSSAIWAPQITGSPLCYTYGLDSLKSDQMRIKRGAYSLINPTFQRSVEDVNLLFEILLAGMQIQDEEHAMLIPDEELASLRCVEKLEVICDDVPAQEALRHSPPDGRPRPASAAPERAGL